MKKNSILPCSLFAAVILMASCHKGDGISKMQIKTISIENVLDGKPLVESGRFKGNGTPPVILPAQSVSFSFYAAKNQRLTFATMYGWSNDLFFAPENPGIRLYNDDGMPISGDVSEQIKLWDNGTRMNQTPGAAVMHPGTAETTPKNIKEVNGMDDFGNNYLPASRLMQVSLKYEGSSRFTITIKNNSGGTANETPFSPGVWAISYTAGENLLLEEPIYSVDKLSMNGLTNIAEMGDITPLDAWLTQHTGIFTPLSPVLVVVYSGESNPFYKTGESDRGEGLKDLAQTGNAEPLAEVLKTRPGIRNVYVLKDISNTVLLPKIDDAPGGKVSQELSLLPDDRIAIATMYGFSNDWFFATTGSDIDGAQKGDVTATIGLFDDGTAVNQYPGAGITQANLAGTPLQESKAIQPVPNPNEFNSLPAIGEMIKVSLE
ncbi:hypothetical protein GCM10027051_33710 [Niabella terrae]